MKIPFLSRYISTTIQPAVSTIPIEYQTQVFELVEKQLELPTMIKSNIIRELPVAQPGSWGSNELKSRESFGNKLLRITGMNTTARD